jgi:hypothetical protein
VNGTFFDKEPRHRFNAPSKQYGTCYLGRTPEVAMVESILHHMDTTPQSDRTVQIAAVDQLSLWEVTLLNDRKLVDFSGPGLVLNNIDGQIATGNHKTARAWSYAIWKDSNCVDGIHYPARHNVQLMCVALFSPPHHESPRPPPTFHEIKRGRLYNRITGASHPDFDRFLSAYRPNLI